MERCTTCASSRIAAIRMRVAGHDLVFRRSSVCESNTWTSDGGVLSLAKVRNDVRSAGKAKTGARH
jgi:hypothetical protein